MKALHRCPEIDQYFRHQLEEHLYCNFDTLSLYTHKVKQGILGDTLVHYAVGYLLEFLYGLLQRK